MSRYKTDNKQPRFRYSVLARCVAWANISVQVLFPLAVTFTPVMAARAQHAVQPRLSMENTTVTADNNVEKNVASLAANAGTFTVSQIAMRHVTLLPEWPPLKLTRKFRSGSGNTVLRASN